MITVEITGIGGSEYLGLANPGSRPLPSAMGHGICGTMEDGSRVAIFPLFSCESCVYCANDKRQLCDDWKLIGVQSNGGFQQKLSVPKSSVVHLPATLSWEQAVFIEPFANSINAWNLSSPNLTDKIAVIGAGSLGLGLVACARQEGKMSVSVAEPSTTRREAARELGASFCEEKLSGEFDIVFDTVGSEVARNAAIELTKKSGKCVFLGFAAPSQPVNFAELIRHQKQLIGSFAYSKEQFELAVNLVHHCNGKWVKNVGFSDVQLGLEKFLEGDFSVIKLALRPNFSV